MSFLGKPETQLQPQMQPQPQMQWQPPQPQQQPQMQPQEMGGFQGMSNQGFGGGGSQDGTLGSKIQAALAEARGSAPPQQQMPEHEQETQQLAIENFSIAAANAQQIINNPDMLNAEIARLKLMYFGPYMQHGEANTLKDLMKSSLQRGSTNLQNPVQIPGG